MKITTLVPPAASAVSLAQARAFLRVDYGGEDDLLTALVAAAQARIEQVTNTLLTLRTIRIDYHPSCGDDAYCSKIVLNIRPVHQVLSIVANGQDNTDRFRLTSEGWPVLVPIDVWRPGDAGMSVTLEAGYSTLADIPEDLTAAVRMLTAQLYRRRNGDEDDGLNREIERLIAPYQRGRI